MQKLIAVFSFLLVVFLQRNAFAITLDCTFKKGTVTGIKSIQLDDENLIINKNLEIPLEKTRIECGHFGRQTRFDGNAFGYQVVLKSCMTEAKLEGLLIDALNSEAADVHCHSAR